MITPATSDLLPVPSKAEQEAYNEAVARRDPRFWSNGIIARLPAFGNVWFFPLEERYDKSRWGFVRWEVAGYELEFSMPVSDDGCVISFPDDLHRALHYPWCVLAVPALLVALPVAVLRRAALGDEDWRLRHLWLRLMWRFRPQEMARRRAARDAGEQAATKSLRHTREEWAAFEAAREAAREAAFEAEVERRLAVRLEAVAA